MLDWHDTSAVELNDGQCPILYEEAYGANDE